MEGEREQISSEGAEDDSDGQGCGYGINEKNEHNRNWRKEEL